MSVPRFTPHGFDTGTIWPAVCHYMRLGATVPAVRLLQETYSVLDKKLLMREFMTFLVGNYGRLHGGMLEAHDKIFDTFSAGGDNDLRFSRQVTELVHLICREPGKSRLPQILVNIASVPQFIKSAVELPTPANHECWFQLEKGPSVTFQYAMLKLQTALTSDDTSGHMLAYAACLIRLVFYTHRPDWCFSPSQMKSFGNARAHLKMNRIPKKHHSIFMFLGHAVLLKCKINGPELLSVTFHYTFSADFMELCLARAAIVARHRVLDKEAGKGVAPSVGTFSDFKKLPMDEARELMPSIPEDCFLDDPVTGSYANDSKLFPMSDEFRACSHPPDLEEKKTVFDYVSNCSKIKDEDVILAKFTSLHQSELTFLKTSDKERKMYISLAKVLLKKAITGKSVTLKKDYLKDQEQDDNIVHSSSESASGSDSEEDDFDEQMMGVGKKRKRHEQEESESSEAEQGSGTSDSEVEASENEEDEETDEE